MIPVDDRKAVVTLHEKGIGSKKIARLVGIDVKSVKKIIVIEGLGNVNLKIFCKIR